LSKLAGAGRTAAVKDFDPNNLGTLPIVPLCGTASMEVPEPARATITSARLDDILNWIVNRLHAVSTPLIRSLTVPEVERIALHGAADTLISTLARPKLKKALEEQLKDVTAD
jgi:hypothetical protein